MQASDTLQSNWQGNRRHQTQLSFGSAPGESAWVYTTVSNSCWPFVIHFVETPAAMLVGSPLPGRIPEVHIIVQRRQARTNRPRTQATCTENLAQFGHVCGSWDIQTGKQTDNATNRQTDRLNTSPSGSSNHKYPQRLAMQTYLVNIHSFTDATHGQ